MLNVEKLNDICSEQNVGVNQLAGFIARGSLDQSAAATAIRNWQRKQFKPQPTAEDVERLAQGLGVEVTDISEWRASYRYAPSSPQKARLVINLISGLDAQDALDLLKFEHRRAASFIRKVLESAIANADEGSADVERLVVTEARVDGAGRRIGTKAWMPKDRGRAHPIRKQASHIYITVSED